MVEIVRCDIPEQRVDAIVNAANSDLAHGGGVVITMLAAEPGAPATIRVCPFSAAEHAVYECALAAAGG